MTVPPHDAPEPGSFRELLEAHTMAEEARLARIEHTMLQLLQGSEKRDSDPGKDKDVGRAWRYAIIVAGVVAAIVFTAFQVSASVDGRIDRSLQAARALDTVIAEKRNGDTAHQLELMRRDDAMYRDELAKTLVRIDSRLQSLEGHR